MLEASSAIGGRARSGTVRYFDLGVFLSTVSCFRPTVSRPSVQLPSGGQVELGATWFHGIQGNPLYDIAVWEGLVRDLRGDRSGQSPA